MASVLTVLNKLQELGVTVRTEGAKLVFTPGSKVPPEMVAEIKAHKPEIMARLRSHASLHDIPFPMGYSGLPRAQVQMAEAIQDKLNIKDPVLRKYNILVWVRGYLQYISQNDGPLYEAILSEMMRLGEILAEDAGGPREC
jgi:hypothetical protein